MTLIHGHAGLVASFHCVDDLPMDLALVKGTNAISGIGVIYSRLCLPLIWYLHLLSFNESMLHVVALLVVVLLIMFLQRLIVVSFNSRGEGYDDC